MPKENAGKLIGEKFKFALVVSRFNEFISSKLLSGAIDALVRHNVREEDIEIYWTPGAFEIPQVARAITDTGKFDAVICLGAIIRGATPHFDYIAAETTKGVASVALSSDMPVTFGILTCDTIEQAIERAGTKGGNKGFDAALAAIEMANLRKLI